MSWIEWFFNVFMHLDEHLKDWVREYGTWTYVILFAIVFCETGLVVTPILPGDSLLFAAGAVASAGEMNVWLLVALLFIAAVLGDTVNYHVGKFIGPRAFRSQSRFLNRKHLDRTHAFFEKYGGKTIIIARFVPIVRTFAPFVAGIGAMSYGKFILYNVVGGALWVVSLTLAGYWFAEFEFVKKNFTLVIFAIIIISILPAVIELWRARRAARASGSRVSPARDAKPDENAAPPVPASSESSRP